MVNKNKAKQIKTYSINFGPQHPSAHGVLRLLLEMQGEKILNVDPHIGLLHRGTEKLLEHKTYMQGLPYMDRLDYVSMMAQEHCFSIAIEDLTNTLLTNKIKYIRVIFLEITRILNHLMSLTTHAMDVGALTPFLWAFEEREKLMELYERVSGARMHANYIRPGGVAQDLPNGTLESIFIFVKQFSSRLDEITDLLKNNRIWQQRLLGIGIVNQPQALQWGFSGVMLRGSGSLWDLRKCFPYENYNILKFKIPVGATGDCFDRYLVRVAELRSSLSIILQCINHFPFVGEIKVSSDFLITSPEKKTIKNNMEAVIRHFRVMTGRTNFLPFGERYSAVESPKGEFGIFIISNGENAPYRVKIRAPGFYHLQGVKLLSYQHLLADVVTIIGTADVVFGEIDR